MYTVPIPGTKNMNQQQQQQQDSIIYVPGGKA